MKIKYEKHMLFYSYVNLRATRRKVAIYVMVFLVASLFSRMSEANPNTSLVP